MEKALGEIPNRINELLKRESVPLKGIVNLTLSVKMNVKAKMMTVDGHGLGGTINSL